MTRITTTTSRPRTLALHTLHCAPCKIKARRLIEQPEHLEKQELLCAIEYCEFRSSGRALHA